MHADPTTRWIQYGPGRLQFGDLQSAFTGATERLQDEVTASDEAIADEIQLAAALTPLHGL